MVFHVSLSKKPVIAEKWVPSLFLFCRFYIQILPNCRVGPTHLSAFRSLGNLFGVSAVRFCSLA